VVLLGDSVYASTRSGMFIHANAKTGEIVWTNEDCEGEGLNTPAVHGDRVVFTANDGVLYALDRNTGALQWKEKLRGALSSPILAGDKVAASGRGTLHLLRLSDGRRLWSYEVGDDITAPIVAGRLLVVGTEDGALVAFGEG
jgi:outer membrane protein assembly factor BamB